MAFWLRALLSLGLLLGAQAAWAKGPPVWVALSGGDASGLEVADALRRKLADAEVEVRPWREFTAPAPAPRVIVTVGAEALNRMAEAAAWPRVPIVAVLVSRQTLQQAMATSEQPLTGIFLDQPVARQLALLRLAAPERNRVGVLLGAASRRYQGEIGAALREAGLAGTTATVEDADQLAQQLQSVLGDSDVLLSVADAEVYNGKTAHNILMSAYRRRVPVLGYSAAFVRAGALMAVYSTPEQIGRQAAGLVAEVLAGRKPGWQAPIEFKVAVNVNVAHSFGLSLDEDRLALQLRREPGSR